MSSSDSVWNDARGTLTGGNSVLPSFCNTTRCRTLLLKNRRNKAAVDFLIFRQQNGLPFGRNSSHFCLVSGLKGRSIARLYLRRIWRHQHYAPQCIFHTATHDFDTAVLFASGSRGSRNSLPSGSKACAATSPGGHAGAEQRV